MMSAIKKNLEIFLIILLSLKACTGQQTIIVLEQGALVGLKIFPDSSRTAVYAFLGIPYAKAPVGELRFSNPRPHSGWNGTLQATSMKPICPQLTDTIYDETADGGSLAPPARMDEDCLYLNVWIPETAMRHGNLPVLAIVTGEEMSYDWPRYRATGLDISAEGIIVVTIQYRTNIFGWISLSTPDLDLGGNYGLRDQQLALQWIQRNIKNFGGRPSDVTLLGHGTSGAACALSHALIWHENDRLFSKLVMMSGGSIDNVLDSKRNVEEASRILVRKLGCHFEENGKQTAACIRTKSVSDLLKAFESIYDHGNGTVNLGPLITEKWRQVLVNKVNNVEFPSLIIGITSNEGAFLEDYWMDMARESYESLRAYVNYTIYPKILRKFANDNSGANQQLIAALNWRYFSGELATTGGSIPHLLSALQRLISESFFERPFSNLLELLTEEKKEQQMDTSNSEILNIFAYILDIPNSMDMRGRINLFGGTSHTADLPFLFGPSLFQQISRRRFTSEEEKLCRKIRTAFVNFIKSGYPTPGRIFDDWMPYTRNQTFIYRLGQETEARPAERTAGQLGIDSLNGNLPLIEKLLDREKQGTPAPPLSRLHRHDFNNPYQLSSGPIAIDQRRIKGATYGSTYLSNKHDSGYGNHLKELNGFWQLLIPTLRNADGSIGSDITEHMRLMEATADAARYKQGFFAMLGLVCALLAILCICVYLLRHDPLKVMSASTRPSESFCL